LQSGFFAYVWRHSRREQLVVLFLVLASLPFYWVSLDIPKRIVNDAIQGRAFRDGLAEARLFEVTLGLPDLLGGGSITLTEGLLLAQLPYLLALSFLFLGLTLVNGAFKYVINVRKGILGERMLRRLRFELFTLVMRFRPETIRATKSAEIASMVKDEVEPIGGFFGEAFITPAFLGAQAVTALLFIMTQNILMGILAGAVIAVQGIIIPRLRKEQLRLGRKRQVASRKFAGRVSEMVDAAPLLHGHGLVPHFGAEIGTRLAHLFDIRMRLFRRKFSVKFLNNLLAQATPFIFYTLGGYLALKGRLDIGQLVAVIAAYRDLPGPVKELIDWDQQRADVLVKFEQVVGAFSRELMPETADDAPIPPEAPIQTVALRVSNARGIVQLDALSLVIRRPAHVALVGPQGSARDILPKVLGRQISDFSGEIMIGGRPIGTLCDKAASRALLYVGADPHIMSGTIRENIALVARLRTPPTFGADDAVRDGPRQRDEAEMTGNPPVSGESDWIDYALLGVDGPAGLNAAIIAALRTVRGYESVFQAGLSGRVGPYVDAGVEARIVQARGTIRDLLSARGLMGSVEPFDHRRYNSLATIGENLMFGRATGGRFDLAHFARDPFARGLLEAEALIEPLTRIGLRIVETVLDITAELPPGSPLADRYSFVDTSDREALAELLRAARRGRGGRMSGRVRDKLLGYALAYIEPRHRLNLIDDLLAARILRARNSFRLYIAARAASEIEFYDFGQVMHSAPIRDNLLFGRIGYGMQGVRGKIEAAMLEALKTHELETFVIEQGLAQETGPGGRLLTPEQRALIALARAVLVRPDTLILDNALAAFPATDQAGIIAGLREAFMGRSLLVTLPDETAASGFDRILTFQGTRLTSDRGVDDPASSRAA
jgi:putative ABC transport system ATP-binding protein